MNEQRKSTREESSVNVDALFKMIRELPAQITKDMQPLHDIVESLPRDAQGVPSPFLHRVQHEEQSRKYKNFILFKDGLITRSGQVILIIALVMLSNSQITNWLTDLAKALLKFIQ